MNTIKSIYKSYIEVNKSKFYGFLMPLESVDEFKAKLKELEKEHSKAKHIVYAYKINEKTKSCDDQEPKGTAGRPLLELILKKNLNHVVIFVVRYYGGTNLGAGRLLRTYLQTGVEAVNKAEIVEEWYGKL